MTTHGAEDILCSAAKHGDLALVQYLLKQRPGYQPGGKVFAAAAAAGCKALLEWLAEEHPSSLSGPWVASAWVTLLRP